MNREHLRDGYQPKDITRDPRPTTGHQPAQSPTNVVPPPNGPAYKPDNNKKQ